MFTTLVRNFGVKGLEVVELYDIEPSVTEHLRPHGLIFCFLWHKDPHKSGDFEDPAAEHVWFANQLNDDACASFAILNVLLNCPDCDIGSTLVDFKKETEKMSSKASSSIALNLNAFFIAKAFTDEGTSDLQSSSHPGST